MRAPDWALLASFFDRVEDGHSRTHDQAGSLAGFVACKGPIRRLDQAANLSGRQCLLDWPGTLTRDGYILVEPAFGRAVCSGGVLIR